MNRVDRLLAMILYLQGRRYSSARQLAEHFGLSERTVYRDLAALGEAGVPISMSAGRGYRLLADYHLPPVNFTAEEASAILTGGLLLAHHSGENTQRYLQSALSKIRAVSSGVNQPYLDTLPNTMRVTTGNCGAEELSLLQQAIVQQQVLTFDYCKYLHTDHQRREVEAHGLIFYLQRWHLIAWCRTRQAFRDFRVDRMQLLQLTNIQFLPRPSFSLEDYIARQMPEPALQGDILLDNALLDKAKREWWLGLTVVEPGEPYSRIRLRCHDWPSLAAWVLSLGIQAKAVAPAALKQTLLTLAAQTLAHHQQYE